MTDLKISIVVPIYKPHFPLFSDIVNQIMKQTEKPFEVIVACSECNETDKTTYFTIHNDIFNKNNITYIISDTINKCYAGPNRNRGALLASGDYVMFLDADDIISPYKIEISKKILSKYEPNMFIHSFVWNKNIDYEFKNYDINNITIIDNQKIFDDTKAKFKHKFYPRNRNKEYIGKYPTQIFINSTDPTTYYHIHQGFICVKKNIFSTHQYTDKPRGQDGLFVRDVLCSDGKIIYSPLELLNYRPDI
jgi:glycosyltransferase involved in cell wall biosynthesis